MELITIKRMVATRGIDARQFSVLIVNQGLPGGIDGKCDLSTGNHAGTDRLKRHAMNSGTSGQCRRIQ